MIEDFDVKITLNLLKPLLKNLEFIVAPKVGAEFLLKNSPVSESFSLSQFSNIF